MKAAPSIQLRLLDVQAVDIARAQLAHRRATLPELARLKQLAQETKTAEAGLDQVRDRLNGLDKQIRALENEVEIVSARARKDTDRMNSGAISASRELESLQHEVQTLTAKQSELEDRQLELMEQRDAVGTDVAAAAKQFEQLRDDYATTVAARDTVFAEIDVSDAHHVAERQKLVAQLPEDLLALYERLRAAQGGVGAAALRAKRCQGCRIELFGTALAELRKAAEDEVVRCDECNRILVRTAESGL